jgi:predicted Rossmann fold nucleotide-binding protein DprA/Smf involved in DNA uptake
MASIDQIAHSLDGRIAELTGEIDSLERARHALTNDGSSRASVAEHVPEASAPRAAPTTRARRASNPRKRSKKTVVLPAGKLETLLAAADDGISASAIAEEENASYDQVLTLLRELEQAGRVRRTGSRRTSRWRVVTDDERVAARAAELEARSRAAKRPSSR